MVQHVATVTRAHVPLPSRSHAPMHHKVSLPSMSHAPMHHTRSCPTALNVPCSNASQGLTAAHCAHVPCPTALNVPCSNASQGPTALNAPCSNTSQGLTALNVPLPSCPTALMSHCPHVPLPSMSHEGLTACLKPSLFSHTPHQLPSMSHCPQCPIPLTQHHSLLTQAPSWRARPHRAWAEVQQAPQPRLNALASLYRDLPQRASKIGYKTHAQNAKHIVELNANLNFF